MANKINLKLILELKASRLSQNAIASTWHGGNFGIIETFVSDMDSLFSQTALAFALFGA